MLAFATHAGPVKIGKWRLQAYNLADGRRILDKSSFKEVLAIDPTSKGNAALMQTLARHPVLRATAATANLPDFEQAITFKDSSGKFTTGYEAEALVNTCKFLLKARELGTLRSVAELRYAQAAEGLIVSLANVGIIALIDEATGFQKTRQDDALQSLFDKFLLKEFTSWVKQFPDDFYREIFRLHNWPWQGRSVNPPQCVAQITNQIVYERLAPGVLVELNRRNPILADGEREARHHQWLTPDVGHPALTLHLFAVTALMRASKTWGAFLDALEDAFPKPGDQLSMGLDQYTARG